MSVVLMQRTIDERKRNLLRQLGKATPTTTEDDMRWEETLALHGKDVKVRGVHFNNHSYRWYATANVQCKY